MQGGGEGKSKTFEAGRMQKLDRQPFRVSLDGGVGKSFFVIAADVSAAGEGMEVADWK